LEVSQKLSIINKNMNMTEEEFENWQAVSYRMDNEGIDYCFEHYSSFEEIKDEEFHKLRLEFLNSMKKIREYVKDKIGNYEEDYDNDGF
jgi:hypothetical protein